MDETLMKIKPRLPFVIIGLLVLAILFFILFWPKKEFPVKVGQVWKCTMEAIPFKDNRELEPVMVTSRDSIYRISEDGKISYIRNGTDSMEADLEIFMFNSIRHR